jgi:hypothetical protein
MGSNFAVTDSTEQSCSWEANSRSVKQKNPHSSLVVCYDEGFSMDVVSCLEKQKT